MVPRPGTESICTARVKCNSTKERTIEETKTRAAMRRTLGAAFEPVEQLVLDVAGNAGAAIGNRERHLLRRARRREGDGFARRRKPDGVGEKIVQDLPHAPLVGDEAADIGRRFEPPSVMPRPLARRSCTPSAAAFMAARISTGSSWSVIAPASIEARSRILLMMARSALLDAVM